MQEQFVTYEIALKLKELGFNEECLCTYVVKTKELHRNPSNDMIGEEIEEPYTWINSKIHSSVCTAPLWQQAIDWLRENKDLCIFTIKCNEREYNSIILNKWESKTYISYEEAREQAILKAIELCHNKK